MRDIADMLVRAGRGEVYREISADQRRRARSARPRGRRRSDQWPRRKSASPVIHAIDVFAPLVIGLGVPDRWPAIVAINALPLRHRKNPHG